MSAIIDRCPHCRQPVARAGVRTSIAQRALLERALAHCGLLVLRSTRDSEVDIAAAERLYRQNVFDARHYECGEKENRWTYRLSEEGIVLARTVCAP